MIGRLQGILLEKHPPSLLLDVGGVGYEVNASMNTFFHLPEVGQTVILHTHMVVREDAQLLYGFYELRERSLFRVLLKVNGVGPKLAITILSSIDPDRFAQCVQENDTASLVRLPGVGKKTAERLIIEMRDRLVDWAPAQHSTADSTDQLLSNTSAFQEALSALVALGYKNLDAQRLVKQFDDGNRSSEELIRAALKGSYE